MQYIKTSGRFRRVILFLPYYAIRSRAQMVYKTFGSVQVSALILRQTNKASPAGSVVAQKARVALNLKRYKTCVTYIRHLTDCQVLHCRL